MASRAQSHLGVIVCCEFLQGPGWFAIRCAVFEEYIHHLRVDCSSFHSASDRKIFRSKTNHVLGSLAPWTMIHCARSFLRQGQPYHSRNVGDSLLGPESYMAIHLHDTGYPKTSSTWCHTNCMLPKKDRGSITENR